MTLICISVICAPAIVATVGFVGVFLAEIADELEKYTEKKRKAKAAEKRRANKRSQQHRWR